MKPSEIVYKRCRPVLGTFVEVSLIDLQPSSSLLSAPLSAGDPPCPKGQCLEAEAQTAFDAAFEAIERVSQSMSFHDAESELSVLNRSTVGKWMSLSEPLVEVLSLALELQSQSGGYFNVAIADPLIQWSILPELVPKALPKIPVWPILNQPSFEISGSEVRKLLPIQIDLGGIAKGFAVDSAIEALREYGDRLAVCVNAGGDLRVMGDWEHSVWIRPGDESSTHGFEVRLKNKALATSAIIPKEDSGTQQLVSPYVDILNRSPVLKKQTAVVRADRCVIADAFTKIVLLVPDFAVVEKLALQYQAEISLIL